MDTKKIEENVNSKIKGLGKLVAISYVNLDEIVDTKNSVRLEGKNSDTINKMKDIIERGEYDETGTYCPPIMSVTETGLKYLVSGNHRYTAHKKTNKTKMLVAEVVFNSEQDKTKFQLNENVCPEYFDNYVKSTQDDKQLIEVVVNKILRGEISENENDIRSFISDLNLIRKIKNKTKRDDKIQSLYNIIIKKVASQGKLKTNIDYLHTYDLNSEIPKIEKEFDQYKQHYNYICKGFKKFEDGDYDPRVWKDIVEKIESDIQQENVKQTVLMGHLLPSVKPKNAEAIRKFKTENLIKNKLDEARKICYLDDTLKYKYGYTNGIQDLVNIVFPPQLGKEIDHDNFNVLDWAKQTAAEMFESSTNK